MATVSIYFDGNRAKEEMYYVTWSVRHERKCRTFATGIVMREEDVEFLKKHQAGLKGYTRDKTLIWLWDLIYGDSFVDEEGVERMGYLKRAREVIHQLDQAFTFEDFKSKISNFNSILGTSDAGDLSDAASAATPKVFDYLERRKNELYAEERFGTGDSFRDTASSLTRFMKYKELAHDLEFGQVTEEFLKEYELWMGKFGKKSKKEGGRDTAAKPDTIGIYLRNLRSAFNIALKAKVIPETAYPFGEDGFLIPKSRNIKKARPISDIEKLINHVPTTDGQAIARDLWLFSYLGNGMNLADVARLQWKNMEQGEFTFVRRKTRLTRKHNLTPIQVFVSDVAQEIVKRWGNPDSGDPEQFVFKIINHEMTPLEQHRTIKNFIRNLNERMKVLGKQIGLTGRLNSMVARHSFSTIMKHNGADLITISKMFGHASITTTMNYMDDFPDQVIKRQLKSLLPDKQRI